MSVLISAHLFLTFFMTGLCWFVQVIHYPLFLHIRQEDFTRYERGNFATGYITIPVMIAEWITGFYIVWKEPDSWWILNAVLMILIGISTFLFQVPTHLKLALNPTEKRIRFLIRSNWIRTISWTVRSVLLLILLYHYLS